jgi:hypothetical protein
MNQNQEPLPAKQTLLFILVPMLATFVALRLYLHLVRVQHLHPGGYLSAPLRLTSEANAPANEGHCTLIVLFAHHSTLVL